MLPAALARLCRRFAAEDPDVAYWRLMPDCEEPPGTGDCVALSRRFAAACRAGGLPAVVAELHPGPAAGDPLQGWHRVVWVHAEGRWWGVDWTARQLHHVGSGVDPETLPCPLLWPDPADGYPAIADVDFGGPRRLFAHAPQKARRAVSAAAARGAPRGARRSS